MIRKQFTLLSFKNEINRQIYIFKYNLLLIIIMQRQKQQLQFEAGCIQDLIWMKKAIKKNEFHLLIDLSVGYLISISLEKQQKCISSAIVQQVRLLNQTLRKYIQNNIHQQKQRPNQMLVKTYFCLAITSQIIENEGAQGDYRLVLSYERFNPLINLCFVFFLYEKHKYLEAIQHLNKIKVQTAFQEQCRQNIFTILKTNLNDDFYSQLLKLKMSGRSNQQMAKTEFISQIIKFKQLFFYRCTQIQSLSQESYAQLAFLLYYSNRFEDALTLTDKLKNLNDPPTQSIQQNLAYLFFWMQKIEESIECGQQSLRINPLNQELYIRLIISLIALDKYSLAKDWAFRLMKINKNNPYSYELLGIILSNIGEKEKSLEFYRFCVEIQKSGRTYSLLAFGLKQNGKLLQAQRSFFKSIVIKPQKFNYSSLAYLYLQQNVYLNAIHCYIQAIKIDYSELMPFLYLGYVANKNNFFRLITNRFMESLQKNNPQNSTIQTNLAVYRFISDQSQEQMFGFMTKFIKEMNQAGEETAYSDIATILFLGFQSRFKLNLDCQNIIFAIMMGIINRVKEAYIVSHQIYTTLIKKYKANKNQSSSAALTQMYQSQIRKTPEQLQSLMLQFVVAEMVNQSTDQGLNCFYKCLSYAEGNYKWFYLQLYKKIEGDIDQLSSIDFVANSMQGKQNLSADDCEMINATMNRNIFGDLHKYIHSLQIISAIANKLNEQINQINLTIEKQIIFENITNNFSPKINLDSLIKIPYNRYFSKTRQFDIAFILDILNGVGLNWRAKNLEKNYYSLIEQIQSEKENFEQDIHHPLKIYCKKAERKQLVQKIIIILQQYYDKFAVNQKIKLIFNHFYPFIISQMSHREFADILGKVKKYPSYCRKQLREDLHSLFKEGNRHNTEVFKPQKIQQKEQNEENQGTSEMASVTNSTLIDVISQTKSYFERRDQDSQFFEQFQIKGYSNKREHRKSFDQNKQDQSIGDGDQYRQIKEIVSHKKDPQKIPKILFGNQQSSEEQSNQESDSQAAKSQFLFEQQSGGGNYLHQNQQDHWYILLYSPNKTQFVSNRLYSKFNEFLHLNTFFLLKYISKQSQAKYIAKHILESKQIYPNHSFNAKVQKGDKVRLYKDVRGEGIEQRTLRWIKTMGPMHRFRWITDIALGIAQLQGLGIYHADLFFRNTIKITKGKLFYFKIIDFDKAFKVIQTESKDKSLECAKNLFDFWLRFRFDGSKSRAPKYQLYAQSESSMSNKSQEDVDEKDIIGYIFMGAQQPLLQELINIKHESILSDRIDKCLKLLGNHMQVSHLKQYSLLVQQLLEDTLPEQQLGCDPIQPQRLTALKDQLQLLKEGKINYVQFAGRVKRIGGIEEKIEEKREKEQEEEEEESSEDEE